LSWHDGARLASAASLTIGAEMRKNKVTLSDTPAERKPMNSGTAEQEQNGVTIPQPATSTLPAPRRLPDNSTRVRPGKKSLANECPMRKTMPTSRSSTFGVS